MFPLENGPAFSDTMADNFREVPKGMHSCTQCRDLWRRYGIATKIHVQLENKLRFAALQNDLIETLTRETEGAGKLRAELREEIDRNERPHYRAAGAGHPPQ